MKTRIRGIKKKNKAEEKKGSHLKAQEDANPVLLPLEDDLSLSGERESTVILHLPVTEPKARVLLQRRRKKLQSSQSHQ